MTKIYEFPNYAVSREGVVISLITGKEIKPFTDRKKEYKRVCLYINGKSYKRTIHRLVALTFLPNPQNKPCINHLDGNKLNNRLENLEWCTTRENAIHAGRTGLLCQGENHPKTPLTTKDVLEIRKKYKPRKYSTYKLAKEYGVQQMAIFRIVKRKSWKNV